MTMLLLPFVLSLDSFFASFALGAARLPRSRQWKLAFAFGICDGVASQIRVVFATRTESAAWVASRQFHIVLALYLVAVCLVWFFESRKLFGPPLLWTVPVALCLDNLAGPGTTHSSSYMALVPLASVSMSLAGFGLGNFLVRTAHEFGERLFARRVAS